MKLKVIVIARNCPSSHWLRPILLGQSGTLFIRKKFNEPIITPGDSGQASHEFKGQVRLLTTDRQRQ